MKIDALTLIGHIVRLEPLALSLVDELAEAARHDEIWTYLDESTPTQTEVAALVAEALKEQEQGLRLPYAIIDLATGRVIGSISFIDIQPVHRGVEIGWAWLTPSHWRTGAAREASYLLMRYAVETAGAIRVAFKTDVRNSRSRHAIEALGARQEGVLRNHRILTDGHQRDSIFYSVTAAEWPLVRQHLESRLNSAPGPGGKATPR